MIATMVIAVPTGIKVFSWVATVWGGKLRLCSAMWFAMAFVSMFVIGRSQWCDGGLRPL